MCGRYYVDDETAREISLPGDFMSGIRARRSLPLSGKKHRFCLWQDAITGMKARRGS